MRVLVDKDLCEGCGVCVDVCPAIFELDEDNQAIVMADPVPVEEEEAAREAAEGCPSAAIRIEE